MVDKEKVDRYVRLLDLYGKLLGKTEYEVAQAYLYYGLSVIEIASQRGTSRQAVAKQLDSAVRKLEQIEENVGFLRFVDHLVDELPESERQRVMRILEEN
ncbi:MAG TPA: hypothetical protein PKL89_01205 [Coprothermobacter proteolyticus]|uniref:hypothetical protein n=1 Tax=Coprothermobacter proteolyticus TaxID=35786 RepID=UPI000D2F5890|nr:hypothetical protein [Coprothermobacter proteolyticus]MBK6585687.1 hypothetical protein [Coprothermobacter sp.]MBP8983140.1 hypothetical protein [Coprothermobacter sp.]NLT83247.1 hypothetical protein [Coprothermobacter proteolyticus]HOA64452.1 hypothetical protein [Coprothermobacter proteolyticus]HOL53212.1 hypothetical protein [Coprothermobacter proteolyticus]